MSEISNEARDVARRIDLTVAHYSPMENVNAQIIQQAIDAAISEQAATAINDAIRYDKRIQEQAATIERLEKALRDIAEFPVAGSYQQVNRIQNIAREILAEKETT